MGSKRKRINVSLDKKTASDLDKAAAMFGFETATGLANVVIKIFVRAMDEQAVDRRRKAITHDDPYDMTEEINEMFREYEDTEPTPDNTHIPVIKRSREHLDQEHIIQFSKSRAKNNIP